jgi:hypothetical protein
MPAKGGKGKVVTASVVTASQEQFKGLLRSLKTVELYDPTKDKFVDKVRFHTV